MSVRRWFSTRELLAAALVGLVVGCGAFLLTAQASQAIHIPECIPTADAGFDPLTGLPHGATFECAQLTGSGGQTSVVPALSMPPELAGRRAIPVPLGFAVGGTAALVGLTIARRRRRDDGDDWSGSAEDTPSSE